MDSLHSDTCTTGGCAPHGMDAEYLAREVMDSLRAPADEDAQVMDSEEISHKDILSNAQDIGMLDPDAVTRTDCLIRLLQLGGITDNLIEWLGAMDDDCFERLWDGEAQIPAEQRERLEQLIEIASVILAKLANRV